MEESSQSSKYSYMQFICEKGKQISYQKSTYIYNPPKDSAVIFVFLFISVLQMKRWNEDVKEDKYHVQLLGSVYFVLQVVN